MPLLAPLDAVIGSLLVVSRCGLAVQPRRSRGRRPTNPRVLGIRSARTRRVLSSPRLADGDFTLARFALALRRAASSMPRRRQRQGRGKFDNDGAMTNVLIARVADAGFTSARECTAISRAPLCARRRGGHKLLAVLRSQYIESSDLLDGVVYFGVREGCSRSIRTGLPEMEFQRFLPHRAARRGRGAIAGSGDSRRHKSLQWCV